MRQSGPRRVIQAGERGGRRAADEQHKFSQFSAAFLRGGSPSMRGFSPGLLSRLSGLPRRYTRLPLSGSCFVNPQTRISPTTLLFFSFFLSPDQQLIG